MNTIAAYLMLVTFYSAALQGMGPPVDWSVLKGSPYDGVAVALVDAYEIAEPDEEVLGKGMRMVRDRSGKDPWPFMFINTMVGIPRGMPSADIKNSESFRRFSEIKGLDLADKTGSRTAFMESWSAALRLAREAGSPGAVLDLELYNDHELYSVDVLADRLGMTESEVMAGLESLGAEIADVTNEAYPGAVVWALLSGMAKENYNWTGYMMSIGYISKGFLDRCREKGYGIVFVAGGEASLGYSAGTVDQLRNRISRREKSYRKHSDRYPGNLALGGTIAPWDDPAKKTGWMAGYGCGGCDAEGVNGMVPHFVELMNSYDYVWIYAAMVAPYNPYDAELSAPYSRALSAARAMAARKGRPLPGTLDNRSTAEPAR